MQKTIVMVCVSNSLNVDFTHTLQVQ